MKKLALIAIFLLLGFTPKVEAAIFYTNLNPGGGGSDAAAGTATTTSWETIDKFTEAARSAGDVLIVRRGTASTTITSDITFTSSGTVTNPISIMADNWDLWDDNSTSTQTYTPVQGSRVMASSASTTGIVAGDWIYVYGDCIEYWNQPTIENNCEFAYEVQSLTTTEINLYLPYKGNQSGSGQSLRRMPPAPKWNNTAGDFNLSYVVDTGWYLKGLDLRSTDTGGVIAVTQHKSMKFEDMILSTNGVTASWIGGGDISVLLKKSRVSNMSTPGFPTGGRFEDLYVDCASSGIAIFTSVSSRTTNYVKDVEPANCALDFTTGGTAPGGIFKAKNFKRTGAVTISTSSYTEVSFEDDFGIPGLNSIISTIAASNTTATTTVSTTTNLRTGGGLKNNFIMPPSGTGNTGISTKFFPYSALRLFESPIYADTTSKTYTMYFMSTSTSNFTADPTVAEMWIECEYLVDPTDADRYLKKSSLGVATSTSAVDFNGSTDWQAISVTCQPTQAGVLYLRGWYAKPVESGKTNFFYMDATPVVN